MTAIEWIMLAVEVFGLYFFAVSGVVLAARNKIDGFGVVVVAFITASGGGTIRDLILDVPPFWTTNMAYFWAIIAGAVLGQFLVRNSNNKLPLWIAQGFDAAGLAIFATSGCLKTLELGETWEIAVLMAIVTGVGGGLIRDVILQRTPYVFRGEYYALVAMVTASIFVILYYLNIRVAIAGTVASVIGFTFRMLSWKYGWGLQIFDFDEEELTASRGGQ